MPTKKTIAYILVSGAYITACYTGYQGTRPITPPPHPSVPPYLTHTINKYIGNRHFVYSAIAVISPLPSPSPPPPTSSPPSSPSSTSSPSSSSSTPPSSSASSPSSSSSTSSASSPSSSSSLSSPSSSSLFIPDATDMMKAMFSSLPLLPQRLLYYVTRSPKNSTTTELPEKDIDKTELPKKEIDKTELPEKETDKNGLPKKESKSTAENNNLKSKEIVKKNNNGDKGKVEKKEEKEEENNNFKQENIMGYNVEYYSPECVIITRTWSDKFAEACILRRTIIQKGEEEKGEQGKEKKEGKKAAKIRKMQEEEDTVEWRMEGLYWMPKGDEQPLTVMESVFTDLYQRIILGVIVKKVEKRIK